MRRYLLILLLLPLAYALKPLSVNISASAAGEVIYVKETYIFTAEAETNLINLSYTFGSHYELWKEYIEDLSTHVCEKGENTRIILRLEDVPRVELTYMCRAKKEREDLFFTAYSFDGFSFPVKGGLMVLPANYTLSFSVNVGEIVDAKPEPTTRGKREVIWRGPLSAARRFSVEYKVPKLYTIPSLSSWFTSVLSDPRNFLLLVLFSLLIVAGRERIRRFVVHLVNSFTEIERE